MKRANYLIEKIADPDNLHLAFWKARKGKNHSQEVMLYRQNLDANLLALRRQILEGKVEVGNYYYFTISDPKKRKICASIFGEQVLHHALMNLCDPFFERVQIYDSYACRRGKGTHAALERAKVFSKKWQWFLKLDVQKFFASVEHTVLKNQLGRLFKEQKLLAIFEQIIDSYEDTPNRGLPIGNLSSQYFANHFLSGLDHFIKEQLRIKAYVRYMDDMVLWHKDKTILKQAHKAINQYITEQLKGVLKPILLNHIGRGLPFLGYKIYPNKVLLTQRSKRRFDKKMQEIDKMYHSGEWDETQCQRRVLPVLNFISYANAYSLRKRVFLKLSKNKNDENKGQIS